MFDPGLPISPNPDTFGFDYKEGSFGPEVEVRRLDDIRMSLSDPGCSGPEKVYAIAMDVGKKKHLKILEELHMLYGLVTYAAGRLGREPVRSQGHVHKISAYANSWSTPEVYEIWTGEAIIYMQEFAHENPGRCFAVHAGPGQVVIVPPGWAHATISANEKQPLTFGAWCDRDFGFDYAEVRSLGGLAWFPVYGDKNEIIWVKNRAYKDAELTEKQPGSYSEFGIEMGRSIYQQFETDHRKFQFVPRPDLYQEKWKGFIP